MSEEKKREVKINLNRMKSGEFVRTLWVATAEQGTTKEDLMEPAYWSHVASQLRPYDRIEVRIDDGSFFLELLVTACDRTWAKVYELSFHKLTPEEMSITQEGMSLFSIEWKGPVKKWTVIRKSDKTEIKDRMEKTEAQTYLSNYVRTIAA